MSGHDLFEVLVDSTGLNGSGIRHEILSLLKNNDIGIEDLNLNVLREIMADYLLDSLPNINNKLF